MTSEEFKNLYSMKSSDDLITPFTDNIGFSLVRKYPEGTPYYKDGRRMFIKVAVLEKGFFYEVNMTKPEERDKTTSYILTDGEEYKRKVTNFLSDGSEFNFDETSEKIIHQPTGKSLSMNEFIEILVSNHLSDLLFWKRKLNSLVNLFLKSIFWLSDKHYDRVKTAIDKYHVGQKQNRSEEKIENIDPFFKYFLVSRNTLFLGLVAAFLIAILIAYSNLISDFTLANPLIVLAFFLLLSFCEKISILLNTKIKEFFIPQQFYNEKPNFIEKLHEYQHRNKFNLKMKTK